jgi:hypothetical protein
MNHQKIYNSIIKKARSENRIRLKRNQKNYVYYECHHILPKCLGGTNIEENLVLLTAKEHYICYKLLTYIYKGNIKIVYAFHRMTFAKNGKYNISARDYKYIRELINLTPMSKEQRQKISIAQKGKNNYIYGKKQSKKANEKNRLAHLGQIPWNKNKKCPQLSGVNNGMYKKSNYDIWVEKFGEEIALQKLQERSKKASKSMKGKNAYKRTEEHK